MKLGKAIIIILLLGYSSLHAQEIIRSNFNAFGNVVTNNGIKLSQSVGQASNHTVFNPQSEEVELRQGFQQVNSKKIVVKNQSLEFNVFPNPNNGSFSVAFHENFDGELFYRLVNNQGKIYFDDKIKAERINKYNFSLPPGSYLLQIKTTEGKSGVAKIIILP